jgi:hypothetical protein
MWFIPTTKEILQVKIAIPEQPTLQFESSHEVADHNKKVIQHYGNRLHQYLCSQQRMYISFGSEFRQPWALKKLLCHHPNWLKLKKILKEGSSWPLSSITQKDRYLKNQELILRGNHKSAIKYSEELQKTLEKEVTQGWVVPLPLDYISSLKWRVSPCRNG